MNAYYLAIVGLTVIFYVFAGIAVESVREGLTVLDLTHWSCTAMAVTSSEDIKGGSCLVWEDTRQWKKTYFSTNQWERKKGSWTNP